MEFEWTCCRCRQSNSTCTRCNCNHSYCNICANLIPRCTSQPPMATSAYSPVNSCGYTSSGSSSPVLAYSSIDDESVRPRSTPHPLGILHSTHPANQLSLIAPFYDSAPPTSVPSSHHNLTGTVTTISSNGGSTSRRRHLIRPRLSISHFKGLWSSNSSSCDDQSDDEREHFSNNTSTKNSSMSRVDRWWLQL